MAKVYQCWRNVTCAQVKKSKPYLGVFGLGGVHLVDTNDELLHTEGVSQQSVLTGLTILGDTGFELTSTGSNDQHGTISLQVKVKISENKSSKRSISHEIKIEQGGPFMVPTFQDWQNSHSFSVLPPPQLKTLL